MMKYGLDLNLDKKLDKKQLKIKISNDFAGFLIGTKGSNIEKYKRNIRVSKTSGDRFVTINKCDTISLGMLIQDSYVYNKTH